VAAARTNAQVAPDPEALRIGVSSCLVGQEVRFDGGHKRERFVTDELGRYARFVPVCPEVAVGMGVPRDTLRLVKLGKRGTGGAGGGAGGAHGGADATRMIAPASGRDWTEAMEAFARRRVEALAAEEDLDGYVLKKDSPSCGMERVKRYDDAAAPSGPPSKDGVGLYAAALLERFPLLPVEEDGRLQDAALRENFVERLFAYRRVKRLFAAKASRWTVGDLVAFHTAEKLLLMAHDPPAYVALGRLVAAAKGRPRAEVAAAYAATFMGGLKKLATTRKHANVLAHMAGYFKKSLDAGDRAELHATIEDFRLGLVPLVVPLALFRHHVRRQGVAYLAGQTYLEPHPKELMLRNHV
jgi:uncharacterized protein YbgA (DUF1722 family)/uncharacterized protein YbbK (DUF523 family)